MEVRERGREGDKGERKNSAEKRARNTAYGRR